MPVQGADENEGESLPRWYNDLVRQIDRFVGNRYSGMRRRKRVNIPALLFMPEEALTGVPVSGAATGVLEARYVAVSELVTGYRDRLRRSGTAGDSPPVSLVPHALIEDAQFVASDDEEEFDAEKPSDQPAVRLLREIAKQLRQSMPRRSGHLRLREFMLCYAVLDLVIDPSSPTEERNQLRNALYERFARRFEWFDSLAGIGEAVGDVPGWVRFCAAPLARAWRRNYGFWLNRSGRLQWLGAQLDLPGRSFLAAALELHEIATRSDDARVRRALLTALLHDLANASWPMALRPSRPRRRWSFVLLLPAVGAEHTPSRTFLDTFATVSREVKSCPLLVLAACNGEKPSYAVTVHAPKGSHRHIARRISALFAETAAGRAGDIVHAVPISAKPIDQFGADWFDANRKVKPRPDRPVRDWAFLSLLVTGIVAVTAVFTFFAVRPPGAHWCRQVASGEVVGVTDGIQCSLAAGPYAAELRPLEALLAQQNKAVDMTKPYRTVVFFAPLSVGQGSRLAVPTGIQILRGALGAQAHLNQRSIKSLVQIRLLIANAGEFFKQGPRNGGVDVAQQIIARAQSDRIAAVIGITQSRGESIQAIQELASAGVVVVGAGVSGDDMISSSDLYYQVAPPDSRVAQIMASFSRYAPRVRELTGLSRALGPPPSAVVVYDPNDQDFSADLERQFQQDYGPYGQVVQEQYFEGNTGRSTRDVAASICNDMHTTPSLIIFAARSGVMKDLFYYLQQDETCRTSAGKFVVLAESPSPDLVLQPGLLNQQYPGAALFYMASGDPDPGDEFGKWFTHTFQNVRLDADASSGYDDLGIVSNVMDTILTTDPNFTASAFATYLKNTGVRYAGESGIISLGQGSKYPTDKALYVNELKPDGPDPLLTCGTLSLNTRPLGKWGTGTNKFPCPPA